MATTAYGQADYSSAFKKVIQPYIQDNVPAQTKLLKVLKTNDNVEFINNNFYAPVRSSRHSGITNLASDKSKLITGSSGLSQASVAPVYMSATFDISDAVMKSSQNKQGAVESALTMQMKALTTDFAKNANRQYFSDGYGIVGQVAHTSGSVGAGTIAVQYPDTNLGDGRSIEWYGQINADQKPTKWFAAGQVIGLGSAGTALGTITSVSGGTSLGTLVVTGNPAITADFPIYFVDGDGAGAGTSEIQGVRAALSSGTANYAGLARSLDIWNPQYLGTASNAALTINDMETVYMSAFEYAQAGDRYAWFVGKSLYTKFGDLLTAMRRTAEKIELVSGWSGLSFEVGQGNVPVMLDFDTPDGEAVLLNLDTWTVCQIDDMGFVQDEALRRSDYITFQKVFTWYTNLLCVCPAANGRMMRRTK